MNEIYQIPILITEEYLKEYSPIPQNFNWTDIKPFVSIAEEVHIVPIIGRLLYDELIDQVVNNEVTDANSTLLLKIFQCEAIAVVVESLPFLAYHITEKSITKGKSDNSDSVESSELSSLQNHIIAQLSVYKKMLKEFLEQYKDCYPLYVSEDCTCKPKIQAIRCYPNNRKKNNHNY